MFINVSNHVSEKWSVEQTQAAKKYGDIKDLIFPQISTLFTSADIDRLVDKYINEILNITNKYPEDCTLAVMVQGEFVFTFRLVTELKKAGITAVAARTERKAIEKVENGITKTTSEFKFAGFMEY